MSSPRPPEPGPGCAPGDSFFTTHWTRVLAARGNSAEAKAALSDLCAAYYAPVLAFIRHHTPNEDSARDHTQQFFSRLLSGPGIARADPRRGRFRSYLLGAVKHFLADADDHERRLKRGGGEPVAPLEPQSDTSPGFELADPHAPSPEREFDRKCALALLERALTILEQQLAEGGKADHFRVLKPWLTGDTKDLSQADAGRALGLDEGAVKVAIHRLRRRFREAVRHEIAQTVSNRSQVDEELHYLFEALL